VGASSRIQVTTQGASNPTWSDDGRELFYYSPDNTIVAVPVTAGTTFTSGRPERLFDAGELEWSGVATGNGQRFLMVQRNLHAPGSVVLVRNWVRFLERELDGDE
jgi:hypothetical protein